MYHQTSKNAAPSALANTADRKSQKYNTIDTQNVQHAGGSSAMQASPMPATNYNASGSAHINTANISPAPQGHHGETAATGASTNPSNEVNANSEFIDIMRKIPRVLCERYELLDVLGKGAHGRIYLATDLVTHDRVAIKLMEKSSKNKSKFQREISLMRDMMKLAKKKPLQADCIQYQDPETVQLNTKLLQQQQATMSKNGSQNQLSSGAQRNRRIGFPRLYSYFSDQNYYYLVMQLLGVNLKELKESFKECKFQIQTVIVIALQLMCRLKSIHQLGYIHRDLKPANVVIGNETNEAHFIYLIDFGLAKKENSTNPPVDPKSGKGGADDEDEAVNIIDPKTGKKKTAQQTLREYMVEEVDNFRVVGTAMYAALAAHLPVKKYLKKDDIESLLFLLSYFGVGQLPWRYKTNQEGLEKMMQYKYEIKPRELFPQDVFPKNFQTLYEYIRTLPDDEEADFNFIERELLQAAQTAKVDPSLLIQLDWMNCRPIVTPTPAQQHLAQQQKQPAHSPQTQGRHITASQMSKASSGGAGLKTPLHQDKISKKQPFTMTPDIHTKTYAERSGLGGIATGFGPVGSVQGQHMGYHPQYSNLHASAKAKSNMGGLTIGGQGIGHQSNSQGRHTHNQHYPALENDSMIAEEAAHGNQEDQHMAIPREGNAYQLNKSTKLTLSSKKQYDQHMQNMQMSSQLGAQSQAASYAIPPQSTSGMSALGNIQVPNMQAGAANRTKMNSTMMVKFNSSTEKGMSTANSRSNLNKSTLLPSNYVSTRIGVNTGVNLDSFNVGATGPQSVGGNVRSSQAAGNGNQQLKLNPNLVGNAGTLPAGYTPNDQNASMQMQMHDGHGQGPQNHSVVHLNRSMGVSQIQAAFSGNNSFHQSPPNMRNKLLGNQISAGNQSAMATSHPQGQMLPTSGLQSATNHKFNNLFEKGKSSAMNIKVQLQQQNQQYMAGGGKMGATSAQNKAAWSQSVGSGTAQQAALQQSFTQVKNKERYVMQQNYAMAQGQANSADMQKQMAMMQQSPTLSPTGQPLQQAQGNKNYINYKSIKIVNQQTIQKGKVAQGGNGQFGSRLSQNSVTNKKSAGNSGQGRATVQQIGAISPLKSGHGAGNQLMMQQQQQQARQSKNSSALGIIGGSIVSSTGQPGNSMALEHQTSSQGTIPAAAGGMAYANRAKQGMNKGGPMYNTMYGSTNVAGSGMTLAQSAQYTQKSGGNSQRPAMHHSGGPGQPIHIKIEDQTGVFNNAKDELVGGGAVASSAYTVNAANSPNPLPKQPSMQQTGQKFSSMMRQQMGTPGSGGVKNSGQSIRKKKTSYFNRDKSKPGLANQPSSQQTNNYQHSQNPPQSAGKKSTTHGSSSQQNQGAKGGNYGYKQ